MRRLFNTSSRAKGVHAGGIALFVGLAAVAACDDAGGVGGAGGAGAVTSTASTTSGSTAAGGTSFVHCDQSQVSPKTCSIVPTKNASEVSTAEKNCASQGGAVVSKCPAAGLQGCCIVMGGGFCVYDPASAATAEAMCPQSGGAWTTTPQ